MDEDRLATELGASLVKIRRGGDITFHGPGQLVGYPILDLDNFFTDIHRYMRLLEESIILTLADYGLSAGRIEGLTGVWLGSDANQDARKICAMGVKGEPLGNDARFCPECKHRFALFFSYCPLWHYRQGRYLNGH